MNTRYSYDGSSAVKVTAYAAAITPSPTLNPVIQVTLTGNITINNPATESKITGLTLLFIFIQDGTGGRTVTFGADFKVNWTPNTGAGKINTIQFIWNGSNWVQISSEVNL